MQKNYYSYDEIHQLTAKIADDVRAADFRPDAMVAIGAGGFIPARILRNFLKIPLYTVTLAYYDAQNRPTETPRKVQWLNEVLPELRGKKILLVDEVNETCATLGYCVRALQADGLEQIAVAVLHHKEMPKKDTLPANLAGYFCGSRVDDTWIVYPWEADDINEHNRHTASGAAREKNTK